MSEEPEDIKPKLNLVINYEGQHITVKVKANMPFKKIFEAAEVSGTFKFAHEGKRLNSADTPAQMGLEDGDMIDAHLEQVGCFHLVS
ncbi:hypothetical protein BV22DRAFT_1010557 [Leucogyrophana mollusca]|uniref:Uncharacterized protein n=1 Tax=Leucogyrophana mollusca TaxID=85980 RepID=A0ACB8BJA9_9AGAM|nr:hypothetical protein BV22DRAFT_1010557 [Leucogyrophana mollusca]